MSKDFIQMSGLEIASGVRTGEFTASAVAESYLDRIERINPTLNIYTTVTRERALREAAAVDAAIKADQDPGPLAGVPYSVKNLFDLKDEVTVAGSKIHAEHAPAEADASSVSRLQATGAICLGATNMGEYAYDFTTTNFHYGPTLNPHDGTRSAGGSSGGSAASVAAELCSFSLGTDTNGSIRVPSSFCGVWGLKPTYGRLTRAGSFPFAGSLDTIGVFGNCVDDLVVPYDAIVGPDERDPVCYSKPATPLFNALDSDIQTINLAKLVGYFSVQGEQAVFDALDIICSGLGVKNTLELPKPDIARAAAYVITAAEGGEIHRERLATRASDFDPAARDRFIAGALTPAAWYLQAQRFRSWWQAEMMHLFESTDVLIAPATPMLAPKLDQPTFLFGGEEIPLRPNIGVFTQPITLIGLPVVAVPVQIPGNLPTAIQLIGKPYSEATLLKLAYWLEKEGICSVTRHLHN